MSTTRSCAAREASIFVGSPPAQTRDVLARTAMIGGRRIAPEALELLTVASQGYPYLIQLVGDYAWRNTPDQKDISIRDPEYSLDRGIKAVQSRVNSRVYDDLSDRDKDFLRAMALAEGRTKIADIKIRMGVSDQYVQVYKNRLIDSGYVQSAGHGYVEFSLPYLDQYIRTLIGEDDLEDSDATPDPWGKYPAPRL